MPIYTKTGDKGKTSLFDGTRVLKSNKRIEALGTVDELNSILGVVIANVRKPEKMIKNELENVQHDLFEIGGSLAVSGPMPVTGLGKRTGEFEKSIDMMTEKLPELYQFILPGGSVAGALIHQARTVCRRAERQLVSLMQKESIDKETIVYMNRLSDLLFTMARYVNHKGRKKEIVWRKK